MFELFHKSGELNDSKHNCISNRREKEDRERGKDQRERERGKEQRERERERTKRESENYNLHKQ